MFTRSSVSAIRELLKGGIGAVPNLEAIGPALNKLSLNNIGPLRIYRDGGKRQTMTTVERILNDTSSDKKIAICDLLGHGNPAGQSVSLTLWMLPPHSVLPLHDHPSMNVWCKVVHGELHHVSFDWVDPNGAPSGPEKERAGVVTSSGKITPSSDCLRIHPTHGGVLHEFWTESQPAVFCDVITPPYNTPPWNIECTYFRKASTSVGPGGTAGNHGITIPTMKGGQKGDVWMLAPITTEVDIAMDWTVEVPSERIPEEGGSNTVRTEFDGDDAK